MRARAALWPALACLLCACASVPKGRYGVDKVSWKGVDEMSEEALAACIATKERERTGLQLGLGGTDCGSPPFDEHAPRISLFSWPWTTWPVYDEAIFEVDKKRIERWYQARGFYDARIVAVRFVVDGKRVNDPGECPKGAPSCEIEVLVQIEEGTPTKVRKVDVVSDEGALAPTLLDDLRDAAKVSPGDRFDESSLEGDEARLRRELLDRGYARATVEGEVAVDRTGHTADVVYHVKTGPVCYFGKATVEGQDNLDPKLILDVASIPTGKLFSQDEIVDSERAVYALGTFAAVRVEPVPDNPHNSIVDVVIHVRPGRRRSLRLGVGVMSGVMSVGSTDETVAVPEWDVHLKASYRDDDFLGGMRRLRIEERPRLIFLESFPGTAPGDPQLGNTVDVRLEQPRFIEHRTVGFATTTWDYGPDPFFGFFRHDLSSKLGVRRGFLKQKLQISVAAAHDYYDITDDAAPDEVSSYRLPFVDSQLKLDLRDDAQRPRAGFYTATSMQNAFRLGYGSWNYTRLLPEVRFYEPLPLKIVLAQRFALGALFVSSSDPALDPTSRALGPQEYRLRGGGANSDRGFQPGQLGDGIDGGRRRWEGSLEARVPLGGDFGLVLFFDVGDVSRSKKLRFDHINAATGFGLRYFSAFVPVRLDLGWRIPGWQIIGESDDVNLKVWPSAAHLTIGEAF